MAQVAHRIQVYRQQQQAQQAQQAQHGQGPQPGAAPYGTPQPRPAQQAQHGSPGGNLAAMSVEQLRNLQVNIVTPGKLSKIAVTRCLESRTRVRDQSAQGRTLEFIVYTKPEEVRNSPEHLEAGLMNVVCASCRPRWRCAHSRPCRRPRCRRSSGRQ